MALAYLIYLVEIRDIISTKVVKIEQDLVDKKNRLYEESIR
jgi:hypothetical protein